MGHTHSTARLPPSHSTYAHFLATASHHLPPDSRDKFDPLQHIHVTSVDGIPDCPTLALDDRFGYCFRLKEREGEWGREMVGVGGVEVGVTKGDVLGVGVFIVLLLLGWAVVGVLGWVVGRGRRRGRRGWRGSGCLEVRGLRDMEEGEVMAVVVGPGGELLVLKS